LLRLGAQQSHDLAIGRIISVHGVTVPAQQHDVIWNIPAKMIIHVEEASRSAITSHNIPKLVAGAATCAAASALPPGPVLERYGHSQARRYMPR
jgi:hypothetical protein